MINSGGGLVALQQQSENPPVDGTRRTEILETAEALIASSGLRTSLQEIANAAGILPGSLYHHFESKEAILVELIRRYHADLDRIGRIALNKLDAPGSTSVEQSIVELGSAIAGCAVRHRAALQMSFYEAPSGNPELVGLLQQRPTTVQQAMVQTLRAGRWSDYVRSDIDLVPLADRICQSMMHVGLDVIRRNAPPAQVAAVLCRTMLHGLASRPRNDEELDRSSALAAADAVIRTWREDDDGTVNDKTALIHAAARREFGRKGFETTTVRDIVSAAGFGTRTVYRLVGSKDELLASIMHVFGEKTTEASMRVLRCDATPIEKLDALSWIFVNAIVHFPDEWKIQLAWMRHSPPNTPNPGYAFGSHMQQLKKLLAAGIESKEIRIESSSVEMLSRCVMDALWIPENIIRESGTRGAHLLARDTVVRGIADRGR
jgi:AcrR family transcriptional regulator